MATDDSEQRGLLPRFFSSRREFVQEADGFDNQQGVQYRELGGEHAIWAARMPFVPAMLSDDFTRLQRQRIEFIMERQAHFIYDLARTREHRATFELRFIASPNPVPGQPNLIDIVFLGKVFATRFGGGPALGKRLWRKFQAVFPSEDPFNYPLEPVTNERELRRYLEPIPLNEITAKCLLEIRKFEDLPLRPTAPMGRTERAGDYFAHPYSPCLEFNPLGRFLAALAREPQRCYVGISLRPIRLFDQESFNVGFAIGQFRQTAGMDAGPSGEYLGTRAAVGQLVYERLLLEREQLVSIRVNLVGERETPYALAEALGSEMVGNAERKYPMLWSAVQPADEQELATALNNLRFVEQEPWGASIAPPALARTRYLATASEAYGAFRLPVASESGYLPGVLVKSEPFSAPAEELALREQARANRDDASAASGAEAGYRKVSIGVVYHRGTPTSQTFQVNVRDLTRHTLIAGSTGSGKSTTIKHLLAQLWQEHRIPFLVLYPIDKTDYRELRAVPALADELLVFTLGDESTSPFRFNPFEVPEGTLLKTHLSRLMRVFTAAFSLQDPLPMIYREALRQVYREKGWDTVLERGMPGRNYPIMAEFYAAIRQIADSLDYGREVKDTVRQASVIRIGDLLENAGHVVNVRRSMPLGAILDRPTVMEVGRVGSAQDTALLMGFILMRFAEEVERHRRSPEHPHITVVEEAHRLMAEAGGANGTGGDPRGAAGEDFSNILAEVRGYGEGVIIAEQIPTLLVKGAIGNTYLKIMHWLEDTPSFETFANLMNLNAGQREYARTLTAGFALLRDPFGRPVHVKVPEPPEPGDDADAAAEKYSDAAIRAAMAVQRAKLGLDDVPVVPWDSSLRAGAAATGNGWRSPTEALQLLLSAPMQTCAFCKPLHETKRCLYGPVTRRRLLSDGRQQADWQSALDAALASEERGELWLEVRAIAASIEERVSGLSPADRRGLVYCYFAHAVDRLARSANGGADNAMLTRARGLLQQFETEYRPARIGDHNG
jgi:hypothetical protein